MKSRKQAANEFKTNAEGKLIIREEGDREGEGSRGDHGQEVEGEEEMDIDEVIVPVLLINLSD